MSAGSKYLGLFGPQSQVSLITGLRNKWGDTTSLVVLTVVEPSVADARLGGTGQVLAGFQVNAKGAGI